MRWTERRPYQEYIEVFKKLRISRGFKNSRTGTFSDADFDQTPDDIPLLHGSSPNNLYMVESDASFETTSPGVVTPALDAGVADLLLNVKM